MTPSEFKAWFDGFTEAFEGRIPTKAQWARIKDRVQEIDGRPVTERIYLDRYWPSIRPYYWEYRYPLTGPVVTCGTSVHTYTSNASASGLNQNQAQVGCNNAAYNSHAAMSALGRADAQSLASGSE